MVKNTHKGKKNLNKMKRGAPEWMARPDKKIMIDWWTVNVFGGRTHTHTTNHHQIAIITHGQRNSFDCDGNFSWTSGSV